ncbi:hypothetical protein DFH28DRAFT_301220 [Melampsora americana]|nr:hypothetical protein DFH28DRAFT_301220 [Melampsora americana]
MSHFLISHFIVNVNQAEHTQIRMKVVTKLFVIRLLVHLWQMGTQTLAIMITKIQNADHQLERSVVWHIYETIEDPKVTLSKSSSRKHDSVPFLVLSARRDEAVFDAMEVMLGSEIKKWPRILQDLFKSYTSDHEKESLWRFIDQISGFMSTPAVQVALFELESERKKSWYLVPFHEKLKRSIEKVIFKLTNHMKEHIALLENNIESEKIINIFTRKEQEKLGENRICLRKDWFELGKVWVWKHWAMNMDVYIHVQDDVKGMLEDQVVLFSLIKIEALYKSRMISFPHDVDQGVGNWLWPLVQRITKDLVNYINSLDQLHLYYLSEIQAQSTQGLLLTKFCDRNRSKTIMKFWIKTFYLQIRSLPETTILNHPLETLISENPQHMETVLGKFSLMPTPPRSQKNLMIRFLEFFLRETQDIKLQEIATDCLYAIHKSRNKSTSTRGFIPWGSLKLLYKLQQEMEYNHREGNVIGRVEV